MWDRDESGNLIPNEIEFEYKENGEKKKEKFIAIVLTRVELDNVLSGKSPSGEKTDDPDGDIIVHCVKNPAFSKEDVKFLKKDYCLPMVSKILSESGLRKPTQDELKKLMAGMGGMKEKKN